MSRRRFKARARALRQAETAAEELLWQELRGRRLSHWKFRRQHPIDRFIVDFVTLEGRLIIEVDEATHSSDQERTLDAERTRILEALGFQVLRIENDDVYENMDGVLDSILHELGTI